jgi:DNA-binding transcriptional MerR regulator
MENKTIEKLNQVKKILSNFRDRDFSYKEINKLLKINEIEGMNFYYFIYSGCVKVIHKGEYRITPYFYKLTIEEVYKYAQQHLKQKRKERFAKIKAGAIIVNKPTINTDEKNAIILLKKLGYKIMKPIQQFEEI